MPTISQLPVASEVTAADQIPISQGGTACCVTVGVLLAGTQPAILAPTGHLLGRSSLGPGGPDFLDVGDGLFLNCSTLIATGADHANFPQQGTLLLNDEVVLCSQGAPKLIQLSLLRGLFASGPNISIDQYGTISAALAEGTAVGPNQYGIANLQVVQTISPGDLVAISQTGSDRSIPYANLIDGHTIDQAQTASAASDTDTFLVGQGGNVIFRQNLAAIWTWLSSQLPSYKVPTLELTATTSLSAEAHNGRVLICSRPISITASSSDLISGFVCNIINVSGGNVILAGDVITSSGTSDLVSGQAMTITCATYSGGALVYARMSSSP